MSRYGASTFSSLLKDCVLWAPFARSAAAITAKTITAIGNAIQSTAVLDPWGLARPVGYFDGYIDGLSIPACPDMVFTGDFTIEFYLKCGNQSQYYPVIIFNRSAVDWASGGFNICVDRTESAWANIITVWSYEYNSSTPMLAGTSSVIDSKWHHVMVCRSGTTVRLFVDGNLEATTTGSSETISFNIESWEICRHARSSYADFGPGYLSEMRFSNIARYTSNFTPSTTRFKPDINTKLLLHMDGSESTFTDDPFIDVDEFPIIPSGVTVTNNGTFSKMSLGNNKSVLNFDGSTNYISLTTNEAWNWGANYFSVFCWIKFSSHSPTGYTIFWSHYLSDNTRIQLYFENTTRGLAFDAFTSGTLNINIKQNSISGWSLDTWYHVGVVKDATNIKLYKNGEIVVTGSLVTYADHSGVFLIGDGYTATVAKVNGNIKDLMIFKGRALTQPEIELLMNRTHPITGAGLMPSNGEYYRLS